MLRVQPIIGIAGGIGSGKSFVADLFGKLGCVVIRSDDQVRLAYARPQVKRALRRWWGDSVFGPDGHVDRAAVAQRIFGDAAQRRRLERLLHPLVAAGRDREMARAARQPQVLACIWDTPLLFETHLDRRCDAVVFVQAPLAVRQQRVRASRGWSAAELRRRERAQIPLGRKRRMSEYVIQNTGPVAEVRAQVRQVLQAVLERSRPKVRPVDRRSRVG